MDTPPTDIPGGEEPLDTVVAPSWAPPTTYATETVDSPLAAMAPTETTGYGVYRCVDRPGTDEKTAPCGAPP